MIRPTGVTGRGEKTAGAAREKERACEGKRRGCVCVGGDLFIIFL